MARREISIASPLSIGEVNPVAAADIVLQFEVSLSEYASIVDLAQAVLAFGV